MADLASTDVTITLVDKHGTLGAGQKSTGEKYEWVVGTLKESLVKIEYGDAALTYPANGVPLPVSASYSATVKTPPFAKFGLVRNLVSLDIFDNGASAYIHVFDRTNNTIRMFEGGAELTASVDAPVAQTLYAIARGW